MKKLLLILGINLGLVSSLTASEQAATILEKGKIINAEEKFYQDDNGVKVYHWRILVAYNSKLYDCLVNKKFRYVECLSFKDHGAD